MAYGMTTGNMVKLIQSKLEHASYSKTKLLAWFKTIGAIRNIGEGLIKHTITKIEKMEPGEVVSSFSALPSNVPRFTEQTTNLLTVGAKIVIPMTVLDQWRNNNLIDIDLSDIINEQMKSMTVQIDQFLAYGDAFKVPHTDDKNANEAYALGLFNGGTTFAAGDGKDDIMNAAGDYQSTTSIGIQALEDAGHESSQGYFMFSDNETYHDAELGVHQLNNYTFTNERRAIDANTDIIAWIQSTNFNTAAGVNRIVITNPYTNVVPQGGEGQEYAYRLLQGYNLKVVPLFNGGLDENLNYQYAVIWSGAMEFINSAAIQASGSLTL